jgi:ectoine hydroxylase-related dioxygenase (phytanoyl-CoA dioxygenase family)
MNEVFFGTKLHALEVAARTVVRRKRYLAQARAENASSPAASDVARSIAGLARNGYFVVEDFLAAGTCAQLRSEIDIIIQEQPENIQGDKLQADRRLFGAERGSAAIARFHEDSYCRRVGEAYFGAALRNFSTLAGHLTAMPDNLGSGQGWHRDALYFQYKAMIYLSDVGPDNGPFQVVKASHRPWHILRDTVRGRLIDEPRDRITADQVKRILQSDESRLRTFIARAGTLILFDSSTIHRGAPIKFGTRYALTNYYYPPTQITDALYTNFAPFVRGR